MRDRSSIFKNKTVFVQKTKEQLKDEGKNAVEFAEHLASVNPRYSILYTTDKPPSKRNNRKNVARSYVTKKWSLPFQTQNILVIKNDDEICSNHYKMLTGGGAPLITSSSNKSQQDTNRPLNQGVIAVSNNSKSNEHEISSSMLPSETSNSLKAQNQNVDIVKNTFSDNKVSMKNSATVAELSTCAMQQCSILVQPSNTATMNNSNRSSSSQNSNNIFFQRDVIAMIKVPSTLPQQNTFTLQNENIVVVNNDIPTISSVPMSTLAYLPCHSRESHQISMVHILNKNPLKKIQQSDNNPFLLRRGMGSNQVPISMAGYTHNDPITPSFHVSEGMTHPTSRSRVVADDIVSVSNAADMTSLNESLWSLSPMELCIKMQSTR
jgi:hypothetical protein